LALKDDGTVVAWGDNSWGQSPVPGGLSDVMAIATAGDHSLALKHDGTVAASGYDIVGQSTVPGGLSGVKAIAAGWGFSLALFDAEPANRPPIPAAYPLQTWRDRPKILSVAELLRACGDPDGDALSLTAVSPASAAGGTVVLSAGHQKRPAITAPVRRFAPKHRESHTQI
jgi:hypothetical protein